MSRTIISLPDEDKTWLVRQASLPSRYPCLNLCGTPCVKTANVTATADQDT